MGDISTDQYFIVQQALLRINNYSSEIAKQAGVTEAIQVLKSTTKGKPTGGSSSCSCFSCKGTKIKSLMHMFGLPSAF